MDPLLARGEKKLIRGEPSDRPLGIILLSSASLAAIILPTGVPQGGADVVGAPWRVLWSIVTSVKLVRGMKSNHLIVRVQTEEDAQRKYSIANLRSPIYSFHTIHPVNRARTASSFNRINPGISIESHHPIYFKWALVH